MTSRMMRFHLTLMPETTISGHNGYDCGGRLS